jgi:hypothetical protein
MRDLRKRPSTALFVALAVLVMAGWAGSASAQDPLEGPWVCSYEDPSSTANFFRVTLFLRRASVTTAGFYGGYGASTEEHGSVVRRFRVTSGGAFSATPGDTINFTANYSSPGAPSQESWLVTSSSPLTFMVQSGTLSLLSVPVPAIPTGTCYPFR